MSVDLYDMAERAELLVRKTNFQGMTQDEVIGLFYQEFSEPTVAENELKEKDLNIKIEWMLSSGFENDYCNYRETSTFTYKGYVWTIDEVNSSSLMKIELYKKWYDETITEDELNRYLEFYRL